MLRVCFDSETTSNEREHKISQRRSTGKKEKVAKGGFSSIDAHVPQRGQHYMAHGIFGEAIMTAEEAKVFEGKPGMLKGRKLAKKKTQVQFDDIHQGVDATTHYC